MLTWPGSWMWSVKFIKCCHFSNPIHFGVSAAASKFYSLFFFFFHCLQVLSLWIKHFFWHVPDRELFEIFNFVVAGDFWSITTSFQFLNLETWIWYQSSVVLFYCLIDTILTFKFNCKVSWSDRLLKFWIVFRDWSSASEFARVGCWSSCSS